MEIGQAEKKSQFRFKQFSVAHDRSTMKVGTDAVLIGAWVNPLDAKSILDIGTGSGVIALMLAQRTDETAYIHAVEMDGNSASQATANFSRSPWHQKLKIFDLPIQTFKPPISYDLIVSNPPYFSRSLKPPDSRRGYARHTNTLSFSDLLDSVNRLLGPQGRFNVILPYAEGSHFIQIAKDSGLHCTRQWKCKSKNDKPWERLLLEWSRISRPNESGEIVLNGNDDHWSDDYIRLTKEFYL